jgi:hypothetical protein
MERVIDRWGTWEAARREWRYSMYKRQYVEELLLGKGWVQIQIETRPAEGTCVI